MFRLTGAKVVLFFKPAKLFEVFLLQFCIFPIEAKQSKYSPPSLEGLKLLIIHTFRKIQQFWHENDKTHNDNKKTIFRPKTIQTTYIDIPEIRPA